MRKIMLVLFIMITIVAISTMCFATTIEGENNIGTYNEISVINGENNSSIIRCEIKVVTPENGGIYPNGRVRVKKGNNQKFTFVPDDGYELSKILVDGEEVDVFDFYIFKNVRSDHTIEAIFEKNTSDWAEKEIENAKKNGLVPTVLENKDLTLEITRLEFASARVKLYEKLTNEIATATKTDVFEDCNDTEVLKAFELGITNGVSETAFAPNSNITREQIATMLARTVALTGRDTAVYTKDIKFADESTVSSWAKNSVRYMAQEELIIGVGEGKFAPTGTATREQTLAISERTFEKFSK